LPKVSFLIAGMQKAGTTALFHYLIKHPSIYMPGSKELHFFDYEHKTDWNNPDYSSYENNFDFAAPEQTCGEATPIYTYWPKSLERIHAYNSSMKIIIVLRHRVERAYSAWKMLQIMGHETLTFSEAIRFGRSRLKSYHDIGLAHRWYSYVERGIYAPQIAKAIDLFTPERIILIENKVMLNNHGHTLRKIFNFLEVPEPAELPEQHFIRPVKTSEDIPKISMKDYQYLTDVYKQDCMDLVALREVYRI